MPAFASRVACICRSLPAQVFQPESHMARKSQPGRVPHIRATITRTRVRITGVHISCHASLQHGKHALATCLLTVMRGGALLVRRCQWTLPVVMIDVQAASASLL